MNQTLKSELLVFKLKKQFFAIETKYVKEIIENEDSHPLPIESEHIKRILIYREEAIAVLNTDYYFNVSSLNDNFFIVLNDRTAIPIDELGGIFDSDRFEEKKDKISSIFIKKIFYINDNPISVIDFEELSSHEGSTTLLPI